MKQHIRKVTVPGDAGTGWQTVQEQLESAAEELRVLSMADKRHGILVARHWHDTFTVAISPDVPYGMTFEHDDLFGLAGKTLASAARTRPE